MTINTKPLLTFRPVTVDDYQLLLSWRNDPLTRQQSFQDHVISEAEHLQWLSMMLGRPDRHLWLVQRDGENVGVLRQDKLDGYCELSWTVSPQARGKGFGKQMVKQFADSLAGELRASIKPSNASSVKIALYAGFKLFQEEPEKLVYRRL
jgi:RimJ/RimL family protein N-acetyltransferase